MVRDLRLAHDPARKRLAYLDMMPANGTHIQHRIERRGFPDVGHFQVKEMSKEIYARVVDPTALTLHEHQQRDQSRTLSRRRIFRKMRLHLRDDFGRKIRDLVGVDDLVRVTCCCSSCHWLSVDLSKHNIQTADDRHDIRDHFTFTHYG